MSAFNSSFLVSNGDVLKEESRQYSVKISRVLVAVKLLGKVFVEKFNESENVPVDLQRHNATTKTRESAF